MAKKKVKAHGALSSQFTSDVLKTLGVVSGRNLITRLWPDGKVTIRAQGVLRLCCPIHSDGTPSLDIDFIKGMIYCHGCCYYTSSLFRFLQDAKGWNFRESLEEIRQHTAAKLFSDAASKELDGFDAHQFATRVMGDVFNTHLQNLISPRPAAPEYTEVVMTAAKSTLEWLFTERKRDMDYVSRLPYGVVPPQHIFEKLMVGWFDRDAEKRLLAPQPLMDKTFKDMIVARIKELWATITSNFIHAVSFTTGYGLTQPGRIRLRRPYVPKNEGLHVLPGFDPDAPNGYYGLYSPFSTARNAAGKELPFEFYLVEGEMDATACMEGVLRENKTGVVFMASCGTAGDTDELWDAGVHRLHLISDEPSEEFGKGDKWAMDRFKSAVQVEATVFSKWDVFQAEAPAAKDPDEVIQTLGFPRFYSQVVSNAPAQYRTATEWAIDRIHEDASNRKIDPDNARALTEIAGKYGQCVRHPASQSAFIDRVSKLFNLASGPLRQEIVQAQDTEESFRLRITERMRYEFHPMYFEMSSRGHVMTMFHKLTRKPVLFPMNDGEAIANALASVHGNVYDYVKTHIGVPIFLTGTDKDGMPLLTPEKQLIKDIYFYMKLAAQDLLKGLPERRTCVELNQGPHLIEDPERPGEWCWAFNNGQRVYKGNWVVPTSTQLLWKELDGPGDAKTIFRQRPDPWSHEVTSVQDLIQGNAIELPEIRTMVEKIAEVLGRSWTFVHQDTDPMFLACHLVVSAVSSVFPSKTITSFIGDYHSGKSSLLSIFCGVVNKSIQLLEASDYAANFSPAAIYQGADRSALALALDEFEDDGDANTQKGRAVADISEMLRTIIGETGAKIVRGSNNGQQGQEYLLHTFVFIASILRARKAQDESRRFDIEMKKDPTKRDPSQTVFSQVTREEWAGYRRVITIGSLKYGLALRAAYNEIDKAVNETQVVPFNVPPRYLRNMFPAAALMHLLGYDWRAFMVRVCESRRMKLQTVAADTASSVLHDRLFRTAAIKLGDSKAMISLLELLADEKDADLINVSRSGIYYMKAGKIIVINWIAVQAKGGVLDSWPEYRAIDHRNLKHTFDQNQSALRSEEYERMGVKAFIQAQGDQYRPDLISAVHLDSILAEIRGHRATAPATQGATGPKLVQPPVAYEDDPTAGGGGNNNIM